MQVERITHGSKVLAIILRSDYSKDGVSFVSPEDYPLQLGVHVRRQGEEVKPHLHKPFSNPERTASQEVFHVVYGEVRVELYDEGEKVEECVLKDGDTILLASGGHGVKFLKDTKIIEVKQGPYRGVKEKEFLG
jgi:hypothetical protein